MESGELAGALERLDQVTRDLREKCPWDREQDARSIVPHTVEEAYELAEAAREGDDAAMRDELGDVLFQVVFLSLLLEERGEGDLAGIAKQLTTKLIRRHPHVYPPEESEAGRDIETADDVRRQWDEIKRDVEGRSSEKDWRKPALPALIYANKVQWKLDPEERPANAGAANPDLDRAEEEVGRMLWEAVAEARRRGVDPELALRAVAERHAEGLQK
ncbi:MAG: nucleoside triphosphate pyrophosphohydrolase [Thermoleophilales bacterium]|nr:nucleoside triphosphate pyrophosphohydrolase [Thermoleophilales bacterium]